jgi:4,5-dihydroxyphthalate decarboxylase
MNIPLTMAMTRYDHVIDIATGDVGVTGVDLTVLELPPPEIFARFVAQREWHISELSLAKYVALRASGDTSLTAIPVFPSRSFRHSAIFVRSDGPTRPEDLAGLRIGVPEWAQTAAVYTRSLLAHEWGIDLADVHWVQAGLNQPGRAEKVSLRLPEGVTVTREPERSLNELLIAGEIDAIISAHPPTGATGPGAPIVRMRAGSLEIERDYHRRTGIFPIMHVVALRSDVASDYPWLAANLLTAFESAKKRSLARSEDIGVSRFPVPWLGYHLDAVREAMGDDPWPYGVEANRTTLEAFVGFCVEQGVAERAIPLEELFAPEVLGRVRL